MITFENVSFEYAGERRKSGVKNLNFRINKGEIVLICGGSGSGKSTVTRLINGLCPYFYEGKLEGEIKIDGESIINKEFYDISGKSGNVFQNPRTQFFNIDTNGEIVFGCENRGMPIETIKSNMKKTVSKFHIKDLLNKSIFQLSGGEQQKIACSGVYCTNPDLFLFDEPTSNLDEKSILELHDILRELKNSGKTIVIAEHRLYFLMDMVDRIFFMEKGEIKNIFTREEFLLLSEEKLHSMGLRSTKFLPLVGITKPRISENTAGGIKVRYMELKERNRFKYSGISIPKGEIVGIIGKNGTGKTTFITALAGLRKKISSDVLIDGIQMNNKRRRKESFMVMQDVNHQLFTESIEEEIFLGSKGYSKEEVYELLKVLELDDLCKEHPMSVSGGQKQRIAIAAAISSGRKIIILDEPTSGLDYRQMINVSEVLKKVKSKVDYIIVVTHDVEFIENCCTCVLDMDKRKQED